MTCNFSQSSSVSPVVIDAYKKYRVPPSIIHHIATNNFAVHRNYLDCFSIYHLLYWKSKYLLDQIKDGELRLDSGNFIVIYHNTTRGKLLANPESQVALSFRKPQPEFGIAGYCLVSLSTSASASASLI